MSGPRATVLLVDDDPLVTTAFRAVLAAEGDFRVETAEDGAAALALAQALRPDLIVSDVDMPRMDGLELCRRVRAEPGVEAAMFLVVTGLADTGVRQRALELGADDVLTKPVDGPAFRAKVRALLRLKRVGDQLRADQAEVRRLRLEAAGGFDQLLALLVHLLDLGVPGAADRGRRLAAMARRLAERFDVPAEFLSDLELAALLHEVGRVVAPELSRGLDRRYAPPAAAVLGEVARLRTAAGLVGAMAEHWDGTGTPGHLRLGQIPLRARILRALADFDTLADRDGRDAALAALAARAGTWYDPAVVAQLELLLRDEPGRAGTRDELVVPIEALEAGMVLAADLATNTGIKLLAQGATIGAGTLEIIRQRHALEPILAGARIRRPTA
jgi:response regulator RpfG family c-di-GMP phosphodiesterase